MRTFRLPGARAPSPFPTRGVRRPAASRNATPTAPAFRPPAAFLSDRPRLPTARGGSPASNAVRPPDAGSPPFSTARRFRPPAAAVPRRTRRGPPPQGCRHFDSPGLPTRPRLPTALGGSPATNAVPSPHRRAAIIVGIPGARGKRGGAGRSEPAASWRVCRGPPHAGAGAVVFLPRPAAASRRSAPDTAGPALFLFRPRRAANVICTRFYGDHAAGGGVDEPHRDRARVRDAGRALPRPTLS